MEKKHSEERKKFKGMNTMDLKNDSTNLAKRVL